jgi:hypothetical protein
LVVPPKLTVSPAFKGAFRESDPQKLEPDIPEMVPDKVVPAFMDTVLT